MRRCNTPETCVSYHQGPEAEPVDGMWFELDRRYWAMPFETDADGEAKDTDCSFYDEEGTWIANRFSGSGPCGGEVPTGSAWMFLWLYTPSGEDAQADAQESVLHVRFLPELLETAADRSSEATDEAAYAMAAVGPARHGYLPTSGPAHPDLGSLLQLPGSIVGPPSVRGGVAYVPAAPVDHHSSLDAAGVFTVDLETAETARLITPEPEAGQPRSLLAGPEHLYVVHERVVSAYNRTTLEPAWETTTHDLGYGPEDLGRDASTTPRTGDCRTPALREGRLYLACTIRIQPEDVQGGKAQAVLAILDASTGELIDAYGHGAASTTADQTGRTRLVFCQSMFDGCAHSPVDSFGVGVSLVGSNAVFTILEKGAEGCARGASGGRCHEDVRVGYYTVDADSANLQWAHHSDPLHPELVFSYGPTGRLASTAAAFTPGTRNAIFTLVDGTLTAHLPGNGEPLWSTPVDEPLPGSPGARPGIAVAPDGVVATGGLTVAKLDRSTGETAWSTPATGDEDEVVVAGPIHTKGSVFVLTESRPGGVTRLVSLDARTGSVLWTEPVSDLSGADVVRNDMILAAGHRHMIVAGLDGGLRLFGPSDRAPRPEAEVSTEYPGAGEPVEVDLSETVAGANGPAVRFRADWGDGTATPWQAKPVLEHAYEHDGDYTAVFQAANARGESASTPTTMSVGEDPPTLLSTAFSTENQETTWGVIGIAVALLGAGYAALRHRRRKSRLRQELEALEDAYADLRAQPDACANMLRERRARARGLALGGQLDEAAAQFLERRIEELSRQLRMGVVDERFDFLPHAIVRRLEDMLADGRIDAVEHHHIRSLLETEQGLSDVQREHVLELVDGWVEQDAAGT